MRDMNDVRPLFTVGSQTRALETWRRAERLVELRWSEFATADRASRPFAFALYVAALDAEEAAAVELATACE